MAERQPTHNRPPPVYLDGCPECLTRDNVPRSLIPADAAPHRSVVAAYRCELCDSYWQTFWPFQAVT